MVVCYTGGGTLGHVYPAIAVHQQLAGERSYSAFFIGRRDEHERAPVKASGMDYYPIHSGKLRRYRSLRNLIDPLFVIIGFFQALAILIWRRADVLFSKGGFVTPPVVFAAWLLRIPVISHESDSTPGLATRINSRFSRVLCVPHTDGFEHCNVSSLAVTGNPIRKELLQAKTPPDALSFLADDDKLLLILGGSGGSQEINALVAQTREQLVEHAWVYHQCGRGNLEEVHLGRYTMVQFIDELLPALLDRADLVVARSGANTIAELALFKAPALLIPLSSQYSRGDQIENAAHLAQRGAARVLLGQIGPDQFLHEVRSLLEDEGQRTCLSEQIGQLAQQKSAALIAQIIVEHGRRNVCSGE
ncbi:MAG: UDP-N-acetylglucosamine--N-acetylmuramyl-(pentapeptide) pyrophosphoryl-undecaprenol N-acetylglucosamine transferase [Spirochaetales bacterium]|nr:UDP-N-acetylglucosamine--N-acetylmuramyl-(pentapeptide) pyrophosphoryl-undecaprenol N-acetylglucosamine transferase [Spirochaetales bacterium]